MDISQSKHNSSDEFLFSSTSECNFLLLLIFVCYDTMPASTTSKLHGLCVVCTRISSFSKRNWNGRTPGILWITPDPKTSFSKLRSLRSYLNERPSSTRNKLFTSLSRIYACCLQRLTTEDCFRHVGENLLDNLFLVTIFRILLSYKVKPCQNTY